MAYQLFQRSELRQISAEEFARGGEYLIEPLTQVAIYRAIDAGVALR